MHIPVELLDTSLGIDFSPGINQLFYRLTSLTRSVNYSKSTPYTLQAIYFSIKKKKAAPSTREERKENLPVELYSVSRVFASG